MHKFPFEMMIRLVTVCIFAVLVSLSDGFYVGRGRFGSTQRFRYQNSAQMPTIRTNPIATNGLGSIAYDENGHAISNMYDTTNPGNNNQLKEKILQRLENALAFRSDRDSVTTTTVCCPAVFVEHDQYKDRNNAFEAVSTLLWEKRSHKGLRNILTTLASTGMGKSRFLDELSKYLYKNESQPGTTIVPVLISFNTYKFGSKGHASPHINVASRMLLSYFITDPNELKLAMVQNILTSVCGADHHQAIFVAIELILEDHMKQTMGEREALTIIQSECQAYDRGESFVTKGPRLFLGIDEVAKLGDGSAGEVVSAVARTLDERRFKHRFCALTTALSLSPLKAETDDSGRGASFVALPLLSVTAGVQLLWSVLQEESLELVQMLARAVAGHPRSLQNICEVYKEVKCVFEKLHGPRRGKKLSTEENHKFANMLLDAAMDKIDLAKVLSMDELMMALTYPRTTVSDLSEGTGVAAKLSKMISSGKVLATFDGTTDAVNVVLMPLMVRRTLKRSTEDSNAVDSNTEILNTILGTAGLLSVQQFGRQNWQAALDSDKGKLFEQFHLLSVLLQRNMLVEKQRMCGKKYYGVKDVYRTASGRVL